MAPEATLIVGDIGDAELVGSLIEAHRIGAIAAGEAGTPPIHAPDDVSSQHIE